MKKYLILLFLLSLMMPIAFADDIDGWAKFDGVGNDWDGQKIITNKQYEETIKALEEQKNRKANKKQERKIRWFRGQSLHDNMDVHKDTIEKQDPLQEAEDCQLISIPVDFACDGKLIERGFYRIMAEKTDDGVFIDLYQSHNRVARLKAKETNDDFEQEYIQFAKLLPFSDTRMKVIYGCLDFNAYAYINIVE